MGQSHSFKIYLDVLYIQNDIKILLIHTFIYINTLDIYKNINHKTILITVGDSKGRYLSLYKSIFIGPQFNWDTYYEMIRNGIDKLSGYGLDIKEIKTIEILVIDQDRVWVNTPKKSLSRRSHSTISNHITPIKSTNKNIIAAPIAVMNIKTISVNDIQEPCLISLTHSTTNNNNNNSSISQPFIMKTNIKMDIAFNLLWAAVFKYILNNQSIKTISTLLFLDFRTGRIERYLINASTHAPTTSLDVDFKNDIYFTWQGERYKIFHEFDHLGNDQKNSV